GSFNGVKCSVFVAFPPRATDGRASGGVGAAESTASDRVRRKGRSLRTVDVMDRLDGEAGSRKQRRECPELARELENVAAALRAREARIRANFATRHCAWKSAPAVASSPKRGLVRSSNHRREADGRDRDRRGEDPPRG